MKRRGNDITVSTSSPPAFTRIGQIWDVKTYISPSWTKVTIQKYPYQEFRFKMLVKASTIYYQKQSLPTLLLPILHTPKRSVFLPFLNWSGHVIHSCRESSTTTEILRAMKSPMDFHGPSIVNTPSSLLQQLLTDTGEPELLEY